MGTWKSTMVKTYSQQLMIEVHTGVKPNSSSCQNFGKLLCLHIFYGNPYLFQSGVKKQDCECSELNHHHVKTLSFNPPACLPAPASPCSLETGHCPRMTRVVLRTRTRLSSPAILLCSPWPRTEPGWRPPAFQRYHQTTTCSFVGKIKLFPQ